jgi:DNA primase
MKRHDDYASRALPRDWRNRLPDPESYYRRHVAKLGRTNGAGWAQGLCPFHDDHHPSLSVCVFGRGPWQCRACGAHGDLLTFHERATGLSFLAAVRDLFGSVVCR